ncbi:MAG: VWA domain-containing protein [Chitinophagaceae bacterium]|nr:VWA domain-containing protein [Chitinophagaceae bacterium]
MKVRSITAVILLSSTITFGNCRLPSTRAQDHTGTGINKQPEKNKADNTKIQVVLLLDTSNSMDGLIEQAKSRLWNIINTITTLKYQGKEPVVEIALYEYGNDGLSKQSNYIRQVTPLVTDLDLISEKLFSLRTNGGSEYCGAVINEAVKKLSWGKEKADMKLIYIAGNEDFNQGSISYKESISAAMSQDIFVNTIYCGDRKEGINILWKDGADRGGGKYFNIDSDQRIRFVETPYDAQIEACDIRINNTYIGYGGQGRLKKENQVLQDNNAKSIHKGNYTERAVSKSKSAYKNQSWDMVDLAKEDKAALKNLREEDLPAELKGKAKVEIEAIVAEKTKEREAIQKEIAALSVKRQQYIDEQVKKNPEADDLGEAINKSIREVAVKKGYTIR